MASCSGRSAVLTEADLPPLPPTLPDDASDEAKAQRKEQMQQRRRVQKQLREQDRDGRPERKRPATSDDSARRAATRLFDAARQRPVPLVDKNTFSTLRQLTCNLEDAGRDTCAAATDALNKAWSAVLQRPLPAKVEFFCEGNDSCFVRMGAYQKRSDGPSVGIRLL